MEIRAWMHQRGSQWVAGIHGDPTVRASAATPKRCLQALRRSLERHSPESTPSTPTTLVVEVLPVLAGVAEAAEVMGWDKRRVITYIDRGRFPEPVQSLASGRVWLRADVERYAAEWHARQVGRRRKVPG
jgi:predicted DNA-binding transcriptional regulator AlpA